MTPNGQLLDDLPPAQKLQAMVLEELHALRRQLGRLTVQKFSAYETLRTVCGGGDLLDGFLMLERELRRLGESEQDRDLAAAALSLAAPADSVLDRLQLTAEALSKDDEDWRDQRTARRWADRGMPTLARHLVHLAEVQGRLGRELLSVAVSGGPKRLHIVVEQMTTHGLEARAPLLRLWHYPDSDEQPEEVPLTVDLEGMPERDAVNVAYTLRRFRIDVEVPKPKRPKQERLLTLSSEGRDAPMRSVFYEQDVRLPGEWSLRVSSYRTIVTLDVEVKPDGNPCASIIREA